MEDNINKENYLKEKFIFFIKKNKRKIIYFFIALLIILGVIFFLNLNKKKQQILISEKYIQSGIFLSQKEVNKAKFLLEEIILSKDKFYSLLALNTILEKKLATDKDKVLGYFLLIENLNLSDEQIDILKLKKALYLINENEVEEGEKLLKNLIENNSTLKEIAEDIIK